MMRMIRLLVHWLHHIHYSCVFSLCYYLVFLFLFLFLGFAYGCKNCLNDCVAGGEKKMGAICGWAIRGGCVFSLGVFFFLALVYGGEAIASRKKLEEHKFSHMAARRLPPPAPASSPGNSSCFPTTLLSVAPPLLSQTLFSNPFVAKPSSESQRRDPLGSLGLLRFCLQTLCCKPLLQNPKSQTLFLNLRIEKPNGFIGSSSILFSYCMRSLLIQFLGSFPLQSHRLSLSLSLSLYSPRV